MKKALLHIKEVFLHIKKILFYAVITLAGLGCIIQAAGCSTSKPDSGQTPPVAVAIALGNHANSYSLNISDPYMVSDVARATSNGFVSVVNCDGTSQVIAANVYSIPEQYLQADPAKLRADAQQRAANLLASLVNVRAKNPELDTLSALTSAVRSFAAAPAGSEKIIFILDTGLSTTGELDFRNNLLDADPKDIVDQLKQRSAIPDFTGITVNWSQMGDVAPPQPSLSPAQLAKLEAIWTAIVEARGGKLNISNIPPGLDTNDAEKFPPVSVVNLPAEAPIAFAPVSTAAPIDPADKPIAFSQSQVRFIGDSAEYADPAAVKAILQPAADYMKNHPGFRGLLVGTTATGDKDFCQQLSQARAEAVRDTLIAMGVSSGQLLTIGLGFSEPWHISDTDADGNLVESQAAKNRKVVLMDASSETAKTIRGEN